MKFEAALGHREHAHWTVIISTLLVHLCIRLNIVKVKTRNFYQCEYDYPLLSHTFVHTHSVITSRKCQWKYFTAVLRVETC